MAQEVYSLHELNSYVKQVIALNFEVAIWIQAEIAQVNHSRGHVYIDLIEQEEQGVIKAQARANIWSGQRALLERKHGSHFQQVLQEGQETKLLVKVTFHERWGYSLNIQDIDPAFTLGKLALEREAILEQVRKEKLIGKNKGIKLARVIERIAIISSATAAGLADFEETLFHNPYNYRFDVDLYAAAMQGIQTEPEVIEQLNKIANNGTYDLIVIIRGGGSKIDLAAFDSLEIARAISRSNIPVWTGIGHEIDIVIADLVAHEYFKTPTAVADHIIKNNAQFEGDILDIKNRIVQIVDNSINDEYVRLEESLNRLHTATHRGISAFDTLRQYAVDLAHTQLLQSTQRVEHIEKMLKALDPELVLKRGFTITKTGGKTAAELHEGDMIETVWHDGARTSTISS